MKNIASTQTQSNNKHPRTLSWCEGDYQELFIYIIPCKFGATYTVKEMGKTKHRDLIISRTDANTALNLAVENARIWIRTNHPGARLRFRSSIERCVLFDNKKNSGNGRRIAA